MSLLTPDFGLLFWMVVIFLAVLFVLKRWGFPVITKMIEERRAYISESMRLADEANRRLVELKDEAEALLFETNSQRLKTIADATHTANEIVRQAKERAAMEGRKEFEKALEQSAAERDSAIAQISEHIASLSVAVAEKVLRGELKDPVAAKNYFDKMTEEL